MPALPNLSRHNLRTRPGFETEDRLDSCAYFLADANFLSTELWFQHRQVARANAPAIQSRISIVPSMGGIIELQFSGKRTDTA